MNEDTNLRIEQLEQQVKDLLAWKAAREKQQITFPLDIESQKILGKYYMYQVGVLTWEAGAGANDFRSILVQQGEGTPVSEIATEISLIQFSVNPSADTLLIGNDLTNLKQGVFEDDMTVVVKSTGTLPAPLDSLTTYYVVNASAGGTVIKLSLTMGGAAINITSTGTNQNFIYQVQ